ncbi:hypothetical protein JMJ77_0012264 [Colletotrichum scovillei]|uniref:Uncharacterized protein n=1 Tax=Colletotrichum scovillei TaxID=1209932 RepID=A0A9P7QUJ8_9PEZI|nr:hypothetical protein JMJ78_0001316 [Colletotrichum scovillei]KAG7041746.1 hypothetical protein JMJ77_0012264 [Colletotrichum scovillei]KAG7061775.1 hypothetical protein JMJ76_0003732 [Colletotrichum scovillei]
MKNEAHRWLLAFSYDANTRSPQSACRWDPSSPQEAPRWLQLASPSEHILIGIGRLGAVLLRLSHVKQFSQASGIAMLTRV